MTALPGKGIRALVVDDSAYNRKIIRGILEEMDEVGEVATASDGEEAIKQVLSAPPSIVTLDLAMPRMDGFTFLRWLMRNRPIPVLVVSAEGDEKNVFKALDLGALDFVVKPTRHASERIFEIKEEIKEKVRAIAAKDLTSYLSHLRKVRPEQPRPVIAPRREVKASSAGILLIGASTGGPSAVQSILTALPEGFPLAAIVIQHMPPVFTRQFAQRLDRNSSFRAREAEEGDVFQPGTALVVPGGYHLEVEPGATPSAHLREREEKDRFIPSINMTMRTAVAGFGRRTLGVLLTGMGDDGAEGLLAIREAGGRTIAESADSCVVYGMPRAAVLRGAAEKVLHLERIPPEIVSLAEDIIGLKNGRRGDT